MAEPQKKAFSWDDFDKQQAAPAAAGGAKKPFLWDSGDSNGPGPDRATMEASRERSAQPTQFELDRQSNAPNRGVISHVVSSGKGLLNSLFNGVPTNPAEAAGSGVATAGQMAADDLDRKQAGRSTAYRIGAPLAQTIVPGLNPHAMERAADVGDAGGIVGEGLTPALAAGAHLGGQLAAKGAGAGLKEVARLGLDESGQPKPLTKLVLGGERSRALTDLTAPRDENGMPYETKAQNLMRRGKEQDALDRAAARQAKIAPPNVSPEGVAEPQQSVYKLPEPRDLRPDEKIGYNASTPRKLLLDNALQGRPGAGEMMQNSGKTVMYVPEGGYAPPREKISFGGPQQTSSIPFNNPGISSPHATLNPIGQTGARPIVSPASQFESSFGPEHQEVGDLAEWETGNREGIRPPKKIILP